VRAEGKRERGKEGEGERERKREKCWQNVIDQEGGTAINHHLPHRHHPQSQIPQAFQKAPFVKMAPQKKEGGPGYGVDWMECWV
jgi:hypothetical protein